VGNCWGNHLYLESCYINLCDESKYGPLVVVKFLSITITLTLEMEVALLELSIKLEIFYLFEAKIHFLHKNMWLEMIKVIKPFFGVFEVFWCDTRSQHDGYHVGSILQGFVHSGKLGGMQAYNLIDISILCQGGCSSFDGMFWSTKPYC
jgi:hypothetical protein